MPELLDVRIVTGHNNRPRFVFDCRRPGAILPVSLSLVEFIAACEQEATELSPIVYGGEVFTREQPSRVVLDEDIIMPY